jgi:hypothetical protein
MIDLTNSGYEFCTARMAENWVKYESGQFFDGNRPGEFIGYVKLPHGIKEPWTYRAVKKVKEILPEPIDEIDQYQVNWLDAPEWADVHTYDSFGIGVWYGSVIYDLSFSVKIEPSGYYLNKENLNWRESKRIRTEKK